MKEKKRKREIMVASSHVPFYQRLFKEKFSKKR